MSVLMTEQEILDQVADSLSAPVSLDSFFSDQAARAMPDMGVLQSIMNNLRAILFPGFFEPLRIFGTSFKYHLAANIDTTYKMLQEQIYKGACFSCSEEQNDCYNCEELAREKALMFMEQLPKIKKLLESDIKAAYEGDPAAENTSEIIFCYPSIIAMLHHRVANALWKLNVPFIPRILNGMAHSRTGIDIHPGAEIGSEFFIDHGTGVVIGGTAVIGDKCRLYQGVTLGALSFKKDDSGCLVKGLQRHPKLENSVIVYAGATILGNITIGSNSIIGGNVWVTYDIPPNSRITQQPSSSPSGRDKITGNG